MKLLCCILTTAVLATAAPLAKSIQAITSSTAAARGAEWGLELADSHTGKILYSYNSHKLFTPASNVKLLTTAFALTKLGPTFTVETKVVREGASLVLYGAGDANLSGRAIPYDPHDKPTEPLRAIEALATKIAATGITSIEGDVIGDDTAFEYDPIPGGWSYEDAIDDDGAPVSALCINDNVVKLRINAAGATFEPDVPVFDIVNEVHAGDVNQVKLFREPGSYRLLITGTLTPNAVHEEALSVGDPARFAALALKGALIRHGVAVRGNAIARHRYAGEPQTAPVTSPVLASVTSAPLMEAMRITDKVSQNLHAEILLRELGQGSLTAGLAAMKEFLLSMSIAPEEFDLHDGSGLARNDLITPDALVRLLRAMDASPQSEAWRSLLPVSGTDGSLLERLAGKAAGKVWAKTGSLTHVSALSGYLRNRRGDDLTFSILVNHFNGKTAEMRALIDKAVLLMMQ